MQALQVSSAANANWLFDLPRCSVDTARPDRRRFVRVAAGIKGKIFSKLQSDNCEVVDLSVGGARIRPYCMFVPRDISLQVPGMGTVAGRVAWRRKGQIGLQFNTEKRGTSGVSEYLRKLEMLH